MPVCLYLPGYLFISVFVWLSTSRPRILRDFTSMWKYLGTAVSVQGYGKHAITTRSQFLVGFLGVVREPFVFSRLFQALLEILGWISGGLLCV